MAVVVVAGAVLAVPSMSVDRAVPVEGEIGVPGTDELQSPTERTRVPPTIAAPDVTCHRGDLEVDCVVWSRRLAPPPPPGQQGGVGVLVRGDRVLAITHGQMQAADLATGTRVWRWEAPSDASNPPFVHPLDSVDDAVALIGPSGTTLLDLEDGEERWSAETRQRVWPVTGDDMVLGLGPAGIDGTTILARDADDGAIVWEWAAPWNGASVQHVGADGRAVVTDNRHLAVLDTATGEELARGEAPGEWFLGVAGDVAVVADLPAAPATFDESEPPDRPAPVVRAIDLRDGTLRWERELDPVRAQFRLVGTRILMPAEDGLVSVDASTGEVDWEAPGRPGWVGTMGVPPGGMSATPAVIIVGDPPNDVRALDPDTGAELWRTAADAHHAVFDGDHVVLYTPAGLHWHDATSGRERFRVRAPEMSGSVGHDGLLVLYHAPSGTVTTVDVTAALP